MLEHIRRSRFGRFLSPDNYVQAPDFTQNLNRYSYCLNNPLIYVDKDGEWFWLIPVAIAGTINVIDNWDNIEAAWDENGLKGIGKGLGYFAVGGGKAAATYFGGPLGMMTSSYVGDMTNSLLTDGTLNNFDAGVTTQGLFVNLAVGQLGLGNTVGNAVTKNIGNEFLKNTTKQIIGQNIDGLISSVGQRTWQYGLEDGLKVALDDYTKRGGWAKSTVSGLGQGVMDSYDFRTIARNENQEAMKEYHSKNKNLIGFEYSLQPDTWMEGLYHSQMKYNMQLNLSVYKPSRQFFNYTLPRWYYPNLYPGYNGR